jgi:hypothetical protein
MGIYCYQTFISGGDRNKPVYTLVYRNEFLACYNKNDWTFKLGDTWEQHAEKVVEWIIEYYPGFFTKKDGASFYRFVPTVDEGIQYIKDCLKEKQK